MTLQEKIKLLRKEQGLKQAQFAEITGFSDGAVGKWEQGIRVPELDSLIKLADAFDVSLDVFRQDAVTLDLPHPHFKENIEKYKDDSPFYKNVPLRFGSDEPDEVQEEILDFCESYFETLDSDYFIAGAGQNSEYGTGRYFWEKKIDLLMWIGLTDSLEDSFNFSVAVNTEVPLGKEILEQFGCIQITESSDENWVYVPINCEAKKENNMYSKELLLATDKALFTAMKIARASLDSVMQKAVLLKAASNNTKLSDFAV